MLSFTGSEVWDGHQWVSNAAAPLAASTRTIKHGKTHAQLVQHYTNYFHLWNEQAEKASSTLTVDPNNIDAFNRAKWAGYYATNSAALSHYHMGISQGGAVPYQRPLSPPAPPGAGIVGVAVPVIVANAATETAGQEASQEPRGRTTANKNNRTRRRRVARERKAAREREAREAAEREEREREAREAAEREERERVRREAAEREERVRIRRETLRAEREEREAAAAAQRNAATRISSLEATLEKRMVEEAKDIKDMEAMLRKKKRSFHESMQSMPPETRSRITLDNDSNQNTCVVCHDEVSIMAVVPCGHLCLCNRCSEVCMSGQSSTCPICRGNMQSVLRIYSGN